MGFSLLVSQDHIPVSNRAGFLIWTFMSRRAALNVEFPEIEFRLEYTLMALAATVFILDPPNPICGDSGGLGEQFGAPYDHLGSK